MNSYDLVDVYRTLHKDTRKYSWRRFNSTQRSRLDYLLVSEVLGLDITSVDIMPGYFSDHSLVCIGFKTGIVKRHCPLWKFNNSLLRDMTFVKRILFLVMHLCRDIFLYKSSVKDIYSCFVRTSETPKCIEKWSKVLAVEIDTKAVFDKIFRTTREKCLIWFQYKLLYNLLPTGRFLFQRQLVDSPVCVFCKDAEETLLHMFWDCPQIQNYWFDVQGWLYTSFTHCTDKK